MRFWPGRACRGLSELGVSEAVLSADVFEGSVYGVGVRGRALVPVANGAGWFEMRSGVLLDMVGLLTTGRAVDEMGKSLVSGMVDWRMGRCG